MWSSVLKRAWKLNGLKSPDLISALRQLSETATETSINPRPLLSTQSRYKADSAATVLVTRSSGQASTSNRSRSEAPAARTSRSGAPDGSQTTSQPQVATIYVCCTRNNTICTLVDMLGNTLGWASAGSEGYKNANKSNPIAAQAVAEKIALKCQEKGYNTIRIVMKGLGYGNFSAVSTLSKSGLNITDIHEATPIPHNGCRAPKKRRT